jgi:ubiquinone/menaquinone biosynthesis C-methylase UbiE
MHEQLYSDIYNVELTNWWSCARRHILDSLLREYAPTRRPLQVVDVGCGMGANFRVFLPLGRVTGVDGSTQALAFSCERLTQTGVSPLPQLVQAFLPQLPFPDGLFDVVSAMDVIEHIDNDHAAVRELWRVCKPGGLLLVTVPAYQWLWSDYDVINEHKRRYTTSMLLDCVTQQPCEVLKLSYMNMWLSPPVMVVRLAKNFLRKFQDKSTPPQTDIFLLPRPVNTLLKSIFSSEAPLIRNGRLPFGTSAVCLARKPLPESKS